MKPFAERNQFVIGACGLLVVVAIAGVALQYDKIPFIGGNEDYSAYFAEAGGLQSGAAVQVAGYRVGEVSSVDLDGDRVLVEFHIDGDVHLGGLTEANIRTKSLLGSKVLEITPRGDGTLDHPIPLDRTKSPYQLPDALGDLSATINGLNTDEVSNAFATLSDTFKDTPPDLQRAVQGVGRFAQILGTRDEALRGLLADANKATTVLSERADKISSLISNGNALLVQLRTQGAALEQISGRLSALAKQVSGFVDDNQQLHPILDKLNAVLTIVDNRKAKLQQSLKYLNQYAMSLGETVASGPFFKAYLANLLPGQFIQPFVDAAFRDLGLDPNTLAPSRLTAPQTGQPATPPLPVPYPRTGQGGEPRRNLPDAITGNPGDPGCGPPGIPLPGPTGCYPYREPAPAPAPGGPPPGPPPTAPPGAEWQVAPTPTPVHEPAPPISGDASAGGQRP
ncbi:MCE family protein [Mycobacterium intracellulare]|uniref:MCE family protein n=1 Tax=Mycobacterium intracellulare TaxID=1767 RepID=UPI00080B4C63|nr:MCE family protein [Mycobacterium intracellulare]OCB22484.1 mammalian cell entry protein [Mycobacterium intracellulare subsp. yongonense]